MASFGAPGAHGASNDSVAADKNAACPPVLVRTARAADACRGRNVKFKSGSKKMRFINRELAMRRAKSSALPRCDNYKVRIFEDGSSAVTECTLNARPVVTKGFFDFFTDPGFWSATWKVTKCVAVITIAVVPLAKAAKYVKDLGGIRKSAELIVKAGSFSDLKKVAPGFVQEILGVAAIQSECF